MLSFSRFSLPASRFCGLTALGLVALATPHPASAQSYTSVTNFAKNGNIQQNLQASFPSGAFTANNSFATPFNIVPDNNGNNFEQILGIGTTLTINVGAFGVSNVYILLNAYSPQPGSQIASVEFLGSSGADQTFTLTGGDQIRDFYQGTHANSINGITTQNAFSIVGPGGAGTGNVSTGLYGTYVLDEQDFQLNAAFLTQTLHSIEITNTANDSNPILLGLTTATPAAVPEASTTVSLGLLLMLGLGGVAIAAKRKKSAAAA